MLDVFEDDGAVLGLVVFVAVVVVVVVVVKITASTNITPSKNVSHTVKEHHSSRKYILKKYCKTVLFTYAITKRKLSFWRLNNSFQPQKMYPPTIPNPFREDP